jgi:hypothetical protein
MSPEPREEEFPIRSGIDEHFRRTAMDEYRVPLSDREEDDFRLVLPSNRLPYEYRTAYRDAG